MKFPLLALLLIITFTPIAGSELKYTLPLHKLGINLKVTKVLNDNPAYHTEAYCESETAGIREDNKYHSAWNVSLLFSTSILQEKIAYQHIKFYALSFQSPTLSAWTEIGNKAVWEKDYDKNLFAQLRALAGGLTGRELAKEITGWAVITAAVGTAGFFATRALKRKVTEHRAKKLKTNRQDQPQQQFGSKVPATP
jgi:hypothetical protein